MRASGETRFRGVQTYRQAMPGVVAVCGQTNLSDGPNFIPFVAVVTPTPDGKPEVDLHVARTGAEATRAYVETVARCFDGGGPIPRPGGGLLIPPTVPPLPVGLGEVVAARPQEAPAPAASPRQEPPAATPPQLAPPGVATREARPGISLVVQANANLRTEPAGGSPVLRVARPGTRFSIFGEAPGGWYQVGATAPEGWIHRSLASVQ